MTHERDVERLLDQWFSDGPNEAPDRVIDAVAARLGHQPQRPTWRLDWRQTPMTASLKPLAAIAAVAILAVVGFGLTSGFRQGNTIGVAGPTPTPSPASIPSPSTTPGGSPSTTPGGSPASACIDDLPCSGPLAVGSHDSGTFEIPLTFTTPDGWVNTIDIGRTYQIETTAGIATPIQVMTNAAILDQTPSCDPIVKAGVGTSVQDLVDYVGSHPGLVATAPVAAEVGGYRGTSIDFSLAGSWHTMCPSDALRPQVALLTDTGVPAQRVLSYTPNDRVRWTILDVGGRTVVLELRGSSYSTTFESAVAAAQPILDSIQFHPGT